MAYAVMLRVGNTYSRLLLGIIISDFLMTFLVPSGMARVVIMAAVALGRATCRQLLELVQGFALRGYFHP